MNCFIVFSIVMASALASAGAGGVDVGKDGGRVEVRALPACDDGAPAMEFIIYNEWEEDVKVTRNWLPWNSSPWFEIKVDGIERKSLPSLSRYREDNFVLLRSGEHMSGTIRIDRLFPNMEIPVPTVIRWRMISAPFRSFFRMPQEGVVEFNSNHCTAVPIESAD